jgi:hypothetical protein
MLRNDVEQVFSKAANIIRESIEVEGVLFLDASVSSFGGLVGQEVPPPPVLGRMPSEDSCSDESPPLPSVDAEKAHCKVLSFATSRASSINGEKPRCGHTALPEQFLHRLLQRYPNGKIFNFEADGAAQSDHSGPEFDEGSPLSPSSKAARHDENISPTSKIAHSHYSGNERSRDTFLPDNMSGCVNVVSSLIKMFPGARSVAFVPLWDAHKHRWFAGSFVWTRTPTRIFTPENELSYLKCSA